MSVSRRFFPQLLVVALLTTSLASCGSVLSKNSQGDISTIQAAISQVVPDCQLEMFEIPNGYMSFDDPMKRVTNFTNRLVDGDFVNAKDNEGNEITSKPPVGRNFINLTQDKFFACNSNGTVLNEVSDYEDVWGRDLPDGFFCWSPNERRAKDNLRRLKICEERLDENSKLGFWIGLRQGSSREEIEKVVLPIAETNFKYGYGDYPVAFYKNFAITLFANFDDVNLATIQNIDASWKELVKLLDLDLISNYVSGHPKKFQQDSRDDFGTSSNYGRLSINLGYSRSLNALACGAALSISEISYSVGECGKLEFEVFQSDLNTGDCTFLGYWRDNDGNERIGVVNYCNKYAPGSFSEGKSYPVKVKIDGSTSYITKLGYKNNVLSFSAV